MDDSRDLARRRKTVCNGAEDLPGRVKAPRRSQAADVASCNPSCEDAADPVLRDARDADGGSSTARRRHARGRRRPGWACRSGRCGGARGVEGGEVQERPRVVVGAAEPRLESMRSCRDETGLSSNHRPDMFPPESACRLQPRGGGYRRRRWVGRNRASALKYRLHPFMIAM